MYFLLSQVANGYENVGIIFQAAQKRWICVRRSGQCRDCRGYELNASATALLNNVNLQPAAPSVSPTQSVATPSDDTLLPKAYDLRTAK